MIWTRFDLLMSLDSGEDEVIVEGYDHPLKLIGAGAHGALVKFASGDIETVDLSAIQEVRSANED